MESKTDVKFVVIGEDKNDKVSGAKVYKFRCDSVEEKEAWINAITSEMKRIKGEEIKKEQIEFLTYPSVEIKDYEKLPILGDEDERRNFKYDIIDQLKSEKFFKTISR